MDNRTTLKAIAGEGDGESYTGLRVAVIAAGAKPGGLGGAERHFEGLLNGLRDIGCNAELLWVEAKEGSFEEIIENASRVSHLDLTGFDVVISTKAPSYCINHPRHIMHLVHTVRVFDDMFEANFPEESLADLQKRAELHRLEWPYLKNAWARFANGKETADRLYRWRGLAASVLRPPLALTGFQKGPFGDYFFLPGRLHKWKRVELVINAVLSSKLPLKLKISGEGEEESALRKIARGDARIEFLGRITDEELVRLYSGALAVPFVPLREDFGYVTLEAFASGKPVITCRDSGEPARLVTNGVTGLVCEPTPDFVRRALEQLFLDRSAASSMGDRAATVAADMPDWAQVARALVAASYEAHETTRVKPWEVCVLDMQPIIPAVGGGRQRLLGLYHGLGYGIKCTYVGTYDWPGEKFRSHNVTEGLVEIDVPLSDAHHSAAASLSRQIGGKGVIDIAFSQQAQLSGEYLGLTRQKSSEAQVVVFSHPWVYPLVRESLRPDQIIIYDAHNVEGYLRAKLLDGRDPAQARLLRNVVSDENDIGWAADWILTCSHEDLVQFHRLYGFPAEKMRVVPNGVMAFRELPPSHERRAEARRRLGLDGAAFVAIFLGSAYGPNFEAMHFIVEKLAPANQGVLFVVAGGVGEQFKSVGKNTIITGLLDEAQKNEWLCASDIAVNPMLSGSGTNVKMFDFMAAGLPVVSSAIGARGIESAEKAGVLIVEPTVTNFAGAINQLKSAEVRATMSVAARRCVENGFAWERISSQLGCFLAARKRLAGQSKPLFSVVVPTYERHEQLNDLVGFLQRQIERDFEVVVVDQSAEVWAAAEEEFGFPLTYFHSPVKGAARARNAGAMLAQGSILAFVDDDCRPSEGWLVNSRGYFHQQSVVGVEGLIRSDHLNDSRWRPVTNVGFAGMGFMTANLFVRSAAFQIVGGFDIRFDNPHFREDTDLGWRLLDVGDVPYAEEVEVFHPAQDRAKERESAAERLKFFVNDALLYKKHPERYRALFESERHFERTEGFLHYLRKGFTDHEIEPPKWLEEYFSGASVPGVQSAKD